MTQTPPIDPAIAAPQTLPTRLWALVPCAGSGSRAATAQPKQYQTIAGQALVRHTLQALAGVSRLAQVLVVVAPQDDYFDDDGAKPASAASFRVAKCGGSTRAASVGNGLDSLLARGADPQDWVLVHDAARCLVTPALVIALIDACENDEVGGLLALPLADTLKSAAQGRVAGTLDRADKWLAQTPQMFRIGPLRQALRVGGSGVTDESSAMEAMGLHPMLVMGSAQNFKVTYPEDFALAEAVLHSRSLNSRVSLIDTTPIAASPSAQLLKLTSYDYP